MEASVFSRKCKDMGVFSIITVREGSQGLKNKCVRKIGSKAVFEYAIEYSLALDSIIEEEVFTVVSSDSKTIKHYCLKNKIYFVDRNPELASDTARIEDVIYDAYNRAGRSYDYISLLYGNIPTRYPDEFLKTYKFLQEHKDYDAAISMQNVEKYNPAWIFELDEDLLPPKKQEGYRRQDLKQFMVPDGHTVLFRTGHFLDFMEQRKTASVIYEAFGERIKPMLNDKTIIDIDTARDFELTRLMLKARK
jgi:CMP-N-acetylneuraminic acid synthetase